MYTLNWNQLYKIMTQEWPLWEHDNRNTDKVDEWIYEGDEYGLHDGVSIRPQLTDHFIGITTL